MTHKTNNMKLYTEEQVRKAIDRGYSSAMCEDSTITKTADDFLQSLTPIELPSDEEIIENAPDDTLPLVEFIAGAKWMKEQILNIQNK